MDFFQKKKVLGSRITNDLIRGEIQCFCLIILGSILSSKQAATVFGNGLEVVYLITVKKSTVRLARVFLHWRCH